MKHVRTKRKPNKKNIGNIVFAIIFVFVCMSLLITVSNFTKKNREDISYAKNNTNLKKDSEVVKLVKDDVDNNQNSSWVLDNDGLLMTNSGDEIFTQLAKTELEKEIGLSGRDQLKVYKDKNNKIITEGMLFDFGKDTTMNFWMKDMNFNLDMIWLDSNYKIVHIENNAKASSYNPSNPDSSKTFTNSSDLARYVLEINSGLAKEMNLKVGDRLIKKY